MPNLYDRDFVAWAEGQATLLKQRRFEALDLDHLVEEVYDLANRHRDRLGSHLQTLLRHLLKLAYTQGSLDPQASWRRTIVRVRVQIETLLEDYPSLQGMLAPALVRAYAKAKTVAHADFDVYGESHAAFPDACPWSVQQVLDEGFWPEATS
jgi:hypothetical protein